MKEVKIKVSELLKILEDNRAVHAEVYDQACYDRVDAFKDKIFELYKETSDPLWVPKVPTELSFAMPPCNLDSYDRVIQMCKLSDDEVITLSQAEFDNYVRDEWHWKGHFDLIRSAYVGGKMNG